MARGYLRGQVGKGSTGTYESFDSPVIDIPPNSNGQYIITYTFLTFFAGQNAYSCFVNGVNPLSDAGWLLNSCSWILEPNEPYDCINGACIKKSVYSTPGLYQSLSDCEIACGTGCSGKCLSNADWAQIKSLSNQLKTRNCS
jgi:hypothetical protein